MPDYSINHAKDLKHHDCAHVTCLHELPVVTPNQPSVDYDFGQTAAYRTILTGNEAIVAHALLLPLSMCSDYLLELPLSPIPQRIGGFFMDKELRRLKSIGPATGDVQAVDRAGACLAMACFQGFRPE